MEQARVFLVREVQDRQALVSFSSRRTVICSDPGAGAKLFMCHALELQGFVGNPLEPPI